MLPPARAGEPPEIDVPAAEREMDEKLPGLRAALEPGEGWHTTDTIDFVVVLSGEFTLELDDGAETTPSPRRHPRAERDAASLAQPGEGARGHGGVHRRRTPHRRRSLLIRTGR